jgi:hypothetical protein
MTAAPTAGWHRRVHLVRQAYIKGHLTLQEYTNLLNLHAVCRPSGWTDPRHWLWPYPQRYEG